MARTINESCGWSASVHVFVRSNVRLTFGKLDSFVSLALKSCLSIEILGLLLSHNNGGLCIVPSVTLHVRLVLCKDIWISKYCTCLKR